MKWILEFWLMFEGAYSEIICDCNLSTACDFNCCCDLQCTNSDKELFSGCTPVLSTLDNEEFCTFSKVVSSQNTFIEVIKSSKSSYCIKLDNNPERLLYDTPDITSLEDIDEHIALIEHKSNWPVQKEEESSTNYIVGSQLLQYSAGAFSVFKLPSPKFSGRCSKSPVSFLEEVDTICLHNVERKCTSDLSYASVNVTLDKLGQESEGTVISSSTICKDVNGATITCAESAYSLGLCTNAMTQMVMRFTFDNNGLTEVNVEAYLDVVGITATDVNQNIVVSFQPLDVKLLSGRPGYIIGKPVRKAAKTGDTIDSSQSMKIMSFDQCSNISPFTLSSSVIYFGEDQKVECTYTVPVSDVCAPTQELIMDMLYQDQEPAQTVIASWGDSDETEDDKWVNIICSPENCAPQDCLDGVRTQFVSGIHFEIYYQNTGNVLAPQAKIVGVRQTWEGSMEVKTEDNNWHIRLSSSVSFYDISSKPQELFSKPPLINIEIPANLLYPFRRTA